MLGELFDQLNLPAARKTTGSRGLHVVVPLNGNHQFDEVRDFAKDVAATLSDAHPNRLTTAVRRKGCGRRLYLDVQRNAHAQTAILPFSERGKPGAPVAVPISWSWLADPRLDARRWSIADAVE